jgi:hypothetical protein
VLNIDTFHITKKFERLKFVTVFTLEVEQGGFAHLRTLGM